MTLFEPKSLQILGTDANGNTVVLGTLYCDTITDLPSPNAFTGYVLSMGFRAVVVNDNSVHRLNSAGQWVQIVAGNSTYTRAEIDVLLSTIDAALAELTTLEQQDRDALVEIVDGGAKNLLRFDETSTDNNNVRFTVNADGSITATQIAARTTAAIFRMRYTDNLLSQDVRGKILSGCPSGGSDSTYKINIERRTSPYTNYGRDTGNGLLISDTIADDIPLYLYIQVYSTATLPLTFKPMICTKAEWDISKAYVPYAPTNRQLYEMILQLQGG